jgi:hypothetical protein
MNSTLLPRWNPIIHCINTALHTLNKLSKRVSLKKRGRGRRPKRCPNKYALLIALKEFDKRNLREAEVHLSRLVCNERIDHSVISYWENKKEMRDLVARFISIAGATLDKCLSSLFTMVDATKFTSWNINEVEVTVCNRIAKGTVYPIGVSFQTQSVLAPVKESVPEGTGKLYADAWYDANKAIGAMFEKGYEPIICPNKNRVRGFHRKKARELYEMLENRLGYRQRGRGESPFGSLTNCYGDRLHARNKTAMQTRIAARILCYQVKLLIRTIKVYTLIVRHAPKN